MLLMVKEAITTGSFSFVILLHIFSVFIICDHICTNVHLYRIIICTNGMVIYMCTCLWLAIACVIDYWLDMYQLKYTYMYGYCKVMDNFMLVFVFHSIITVGIMVPLLVFASLSVSWHNFQHHVIIACFSAIFIVGVMVSLFTLASLFEFVSQHCYQH